ncbi:hypothetical protein RZE82_06735 [Mollicutes bacterium LVI A0039]|nr:hypothetical protein RZE82_06735 [Mollicutes bacterium LVI A0039]
MKKSVVDASGNNLVEVGEKITYTIEISNSTEYNAYDVPVRDSMLENLPSYLTYNNDVQIVGSKYTGIFYEGSLLLDKVASNESVTITYSITVNEIPKGVTKLSNVATDNGDDPVTKNPETCEQIDCDDATIDVGNPNTHITKSVVDEDGNEIVVAGENLTYTIEVNNPSNNDSLDVVVRDSMLENLPSYITFNNDVKVEGTTYTGSLVDGDLVLASVEAKATVVITYSITVNEIPKGVTKLSNVATDNGDDPDTKIPETCKQIDCDDATIDVGNPNTHIAKNVLDEDGNDIATVGEKLSYTIEISNTTRVDAYDVDVRDSMLENLPSYITFNNDVKVEGTTYTGSLVDGNLVLATVEANATVVITYSITVNEIVEGVTQLSNIATDNGDDPDTRDPETCKQIDCDNATIDVEKPNTQITKSVVDEDGDGIAATGENLTYTIEVNNSTMANAYNVPVRDSMLENLPNYISFNNDVKVEGTTYTGSLVDGNLVLASVEAKATVIITYSITVKEIPKGVTKLSNIVTDNGDDPDTKNPETCKQIDCDDATIDVEKPNTHITKSIVDENGDEVVTAGEKLTYTIEVNNPSNNDALDVVVRDSMLENLPNYISFNNDVKVEETTYTGSLVDGNLVLASVEAKGIVVITYSITVNEIPEGVTKISNVATDNGDNPDTKDPETCTQIDCDEATIDVEKPNTHITKSVVDEDGDEEVVAGEKLTYTIEVNNPSNNDALDVVVRDSMLENLPSYITFNNDVKVEGTTYTGSLVDGNLVLASVEANATVVITYSITVNEIPEGVTKLSNIATDNEDDPDTKDPETCEQIDCDDATIDVEKPNTHITKSVGDENGDEVVAAGEKLTYTIEISNTTSVDAYNVAVRDSMLENLPSYLTFNDDVTIEGSEYSGSLTDGSLVLDKVLAKETVTITYTLTARDIPKDATALVNIATDNGVDPETVDPGTCDEVDCDETTTEVEVADTHIKKSVADENGDKLLAVGETLTYTLEVSNPTNSNAHNVAVRDSMLENLPSYLTFNDDVTIEGSEYSGSLTDGTLVLNNVLAKETVAITYSLTAHDIPKDATALVNIATDNGVDPETVDPGTCDEVDCDETTTEVERPDTHIKKTVADENGDKLLVVGETLTYTLEVSNPTGNHAYDVAVRDSMLEHLPSYLTFNDDVEIVGSTFTGSLTDGSLVLDKVLAKETVTITYSITAHDIPKGATELVNIATDNGVDPETVDPDTCNEVDCDETTTEVERPDTHIKKTVADENGDKLLVVGETLTYTLEISNPTGNHAYDVAVRDSMLEHLPSYLTFNDDIEIVGSTFTGSLTDGSLVLDKVLANETVVITYSLTARDIPKDATALVNIATDNGYDPETVDPDTCDKVDCDDTTTAVEVPDTHIKKSVADENGDKLLVVGETLTYTLEVSNPTKSNALNVIVRDSMLENLPSYLTFNDDVTIEGSEYSGSLTDGTLVLNNVLAKETVTITYSLTAHDIPKDATALVNIATDNGVDPETIDPGTCDEVDCDETTTEVEVPDTHIKKSVADENGDKLLAVGETLTYTLKVSNPTKSNALNVIVRDSMLENLPSYLTFNDDVTIEGSEYSGSLTDGTLVLNNVLAKETVTITYSLTAHDIPKDATELVNIATDNGVDPETVDPGTCDEVDCDETTTEVERPDTHIKKTVADENGDELLVVGESLTYTLEISNPTGNHAYDVAVRDSMLEHLPSYLTFNDDVEIVGSTFTGSLTDGSLVLDKVLANETVVITYSLTAHDIPKEATALVNIATDNGYDPETVDPDTCDEVDCDDTTTAVEVPDTHIKKSVADENGDKLLVVGETLTYTLEVSNPTKSNALNVSVRDSMLENLPSYLTFNDDVTIEGSEYSGSLTDGTLVLNNVLAKETVTITYSLTAHDISKDATALVNIATDNGVDPETVDPDTCDEVDCDETTTEVERPDTLIKKTVADENGDKLLVVGETLNYTLEVSNPTKSNAHNVSVRDSMLENLPSYLTFNDDVTIEGSEYSGSLTDGTLVLNNVLAKETVVITYSLTAHDIPKDATALVNIATDNGVDPETVDPDTCDEVDCDETTTEVEAPDTHIKKSVADEDGDKLLAVGETLTYTLEVSNPTKSNAHNVIVRDSMLENVPTYLTFNNDVTIEGSEYSGSLTDGTLVLNNVLAKETVTITYSLTAHDIPKEATALVNIATDNGVDPETVDPDTCDEVDCDETTTPINGNTIINKAVVDEDGNGKITVGETLTYTIEVSNVTENVAYNVAVRDSMLENVPSYLTFNDDVTIEGSEYSGSLADGTLVLNNVLAKETVTITYSLTAYDIPKDATALVNIATDNGVDPETVDPDTCDQVDCDETTTEVEVPDTHIKKSVADENGDKLLVVGETLTYTLEVSNPTESNAHNVIVRDSMLENLPSYLTFNDDVTIEGSEYSGSLTDGTLVLNNVLAKETVTITYSLTAHDISKDATALVNIATDNGVDPETVDPDTCDEVDCDNTTTAVEVPDTHIKKSVADENGDELLVVGETLTYTLEVSNPTESNAHNVIVRDSMLENLPSYLTFNDDVTIEGSEYSGSLTDGTLVLNNVLAKETVTITYSLTAHDISKDETALVNIATDNGVDPETVDPNTCDEVDCDETTTEVEVPDTHIKKSVADENGDELLVVGETLTYTLEVSNPTKSNALNVIVRDSMLENLPSYLTFNDDVTIEGSEYSGSLTDGTLVLNNVLAKETVVITYSLTAHDIPKDATALVNIATDNGVDPETVDPGTCDEVDCDETTTEVEAPDTHIKKSVADENGDELLVVGETLTYTLEVSNPTKSNAHNVIVRDSMLENLPSYLTFNDDVTIEGSEYSGSLTDGTLVLNNVLAKETVTITYSLIAHDIAKDATALVNIATDNGVDPETVDPDTCDEVDCDETTTSINGKTIINKTVVDEDGNGKITVGETLTYTIEVSNVTENVAYNVAVRDSMLENLPSYLTFNDDVTIEGSEYSGSLTDGTLVLNNVLAKETVTITYSLTAYDIPKDATALVNIATDNGYDPETVDPDTCDQVDCDETTTEVEVPDTHIKKSVVDENGDKLLVVGETLTYTLEVSNPTESNAHNVIVRDSMLEKLPSYLTFNDDVTIEGSEYSGSLTDGTLVLNNVLAKETVVITYSITAHDIPKEATALVNIATDNGVDPETVDPETCDEVDCDETTTEVEVPDTHIKKSVADENGDKLLVVGETLTYTLEVSNPTESNAHNVIVRDSMLENLPSYLTFNDDVEIVGSTFTGSLTDGTLVLNNVLAKETVTITYSLTAHDIPKEATALVNIATDNGVDPETVDPGTCDEVDCDDTTTAVEVADTHIKKSVADENGDELLVVGETLTYTLEVSNPTKSNAHNVIVRDSMLENLPSYLTFNDDVEIVGSTFTGSLTDGSLVLDKVLANETVVITYSLTTHDIPKDATALVNIATDNGYDPETVDPDTCDQVDCDETTTEVEAPDTHIKKSVADENGDKLLAVGETLTYTLEVSNPTKSNAHNVIVRDSMLENLPSYITFNDDVTIEGSEYSGSLTDGTLVLNNVLAKETVTITYSLTAHDIPKEATALVNIATDNGVDPETVDPGTCDEVDCDETTTPINGTTIINKAVVDEDGNGKITVGETLTYTIEVSNVTENVAYDVAVRDSMLENLPSYLAFNDDVTIEGSEYSGSLTDGTLVLNNVLAKETVTITYSLTAHDIPKGATELVNIATDNGVDPETVDPDTCNEVDCDETTTEVERPDTHIKKTVADENGDKLLVVGETLTYTLEISNPTGNHAYDVAVRDSMLEHLPSYLTFNDDIEIVGSTFTGSLTDGSLVLDKVLAKETVVITYSLTAHDIPKEATALVNIATDNGYDPETVDPDTCDKVDCDDTTTAVEVPDTYIKKSVADENGDKLLVVGETLTYTLEVSNPTKSNALNVIVRDSMLENLPSYLTFNDDVEIVGSTFTGSLTDGSLVLDKVLAKETVVITYSLTAHDIPKEATALVNIATDNGVDPETVDPDTCDEVDCDETTTEVEVPDTHIKKSVADENDDKLLAVGETLTYTLEVSNPTKSNALNVIVRDSMLENLPSYLTFNDDVTIEGSEYSGSLTDGTLVLNNVLAKETVTITYSLTAHDIPKDATALVNIATDNGVDPETIDPDTCDEVDCDETTTEVERPDTHIKKTVADENGDKLLVVGETLTYTLEISNPTGNHAYDVAVRDSMLEHLPSYLTFNDDVEIVGSTFTGSLTDGSLVLDKVLANETVVITYSLTTHDIPKDATALVNIATDNGYDPETVDPDTCDEVDCDDTTTAVEVPDTHIKKSVADENGDKLLVVGETLNYTLEVSNPTKSNALNVIVRDSMLENLPSYLTFNDDVTIEGSEYSGSLTDGTLVLNNVLAKETVVITYSLTAHDIPKDATALVNIATDNGVDPETVAPDTCDEVDCDETTTEVEVPDTHIKKSVADENGDKLLVVGETLTYTLEVSNPTKSNALNVIVRDSMLENLPSYLTFNDDVTIEGSEYSGSLTDGTLVLNNVLAKETVTITYSLTAHDISKDATALVNIATDNGVDPETVAPDTCDEVDCDETTTEVEVPDTHIRKSVDNEDGLVKIGETLVYTLEVSNPTKSDALNVSVRDSMLENLPDFVSFNDDALVVGSTFTGSLTDGSMVLDNVVAGETVVITYSITVNELPSDVNGLFNIATDNGVDPETVDPDTCDEVDCDETTTPINGNTIINKAVVDEDGNGKIAVGETLTYTIEVSNVTENVAYDVAVRDSMLENLPSYLTFNDDVTIEGSEYSGSLTDGTLVLNNVLAKETVTITYSLTAHDIPKDATALVNIATDNGIDPETVNPETCDRVDCDETTTEVETPDTHIKKSVVDTDGNGLAIAGETLTYTIEVSNPTGNHAYDVGVRDSMVEAMPAFATFNDDVVIDGAGYSGSLVDGTLVLDKVAAKGLVTITYSITVIELPTDVTELLNMATDNGQDPATVDPEMCDEIDCDQTETLFQGDTKISKSINDANGNGIVEAGEKLTYTLEVENYTNHNAVNVIVRDSMVENTPSWLTFGNDVTIERADISYTGTLADGNLTFYSIAPGEVVTITYTMTAATKLPNGESSAVNIATDTGTDPDTIDPETCAELDDCASTVDPVNATVTMNKSVSDANGNGKVDSGEVLTYTIDVFNPSNDVSAFNVIIRDSMLENIPAWLTYNDDVTINPEDLEYTGSLTDVGVTFLEIPSQQAVTITYTMTAATKLPTDVPAAVNLATSNGEDPTTVDPETCVDDSGCAETTTPVMGATTIAKTLKDESGDGIIQRGEKLNYTITVTNVTDMDANDVVVRDSMLESTPEWLTYNKDMKLTDGIKYSGDLTTANLVIETIKAGESVDITYSLTVGKSIPQEVTQVVNIATDNGQDPSEIDPDGGKSTGEDSTVATANIDVVNQLQVTGGNLMIVLISLVVMLILSVFIKRRVRY